MNTEIEYACKLVNVKLRGILMPYIKNIPWENPIARSIIDCCKTSGMSEVPEALLMTRLRELNSENGVEKILTHVNRYRGELEQEASRAIIDDYNKFYKKMIVGKIITDGSSSEDIDIDQIFDRIRDIPTINYSDLKVVNLHDIDVNEVVQSEIGNDGAIPSSFAIVRDSAPWGGYLRGTVVLVTAAPGTGKSLLMLNESVASLRAGLKVLYIALGDMMVTDFVTRISSIMTQTPYRKVCANPAKYRDMCKDELKNFDVVVLPAGVYTCAEIEASLNNSIDVDAEYDLIVVDYDANLKQTNDSSYKEGEESYNALTRIARNDKRHRVVMVASQPKQFFWTHEKLPMECAADSSRKQAVVDYMLTVGRNTESQRPCGYIGLVKNRRGGGDSDTYVPYRRLDYGVFEIMSKTNYAVYSRSTDE